MPMSHLSSHKNILEKELDKMQHRNPSQLHASFYMNEEQKRGRGKTAAKKRVSKGEKKK